MKSKILLVDDNITVIKIVAYFLEIEGFEVFPISDSSSALLMAREIMPDVILLDIVMPEPDGFKVCKLLKEDRDLKEIPVIILTAETDSRDLKAAMETGAMDYIRKPVDRTELTARVNSACRIKQYEDRLKEMAQRDSLTGLYNHGALIGQFGKEYDKQAQNGGNIAFIMVDVDFFKKVNDTYGHMVGDRILKEISCILSWSVDASATVSRYGGEEFGIIMPGMASRPVGRLCEEIRKNIEEYRFPIDDDKFINVTVSMGFCSMSASKDIDADIIIKKADDALYKAKADGRNRVVEGEG